MNSLGIPRKMNRPDDAVVKPAYGKSGFRYTTWVLMEA
jgi:hypothetical protein